MKKMSPNLFVENVIETVEFYKLLGFQLVLSVPEDVPSQWAMMTKGEVSFMFQSFDGIGEELPEIPRIKGGAVLFYIDVENIMEFRKSLPPNVTILKDVEKTFYGATEFSILDNNGFVLTFAEDV